VRVLHGVQEIAGQAALSALGLREIGVEARAYFPPHPFGYGLAPDYSPRAPGALRPAERLLDALRLARRFDVFHFHAAVSFVSPRLGHADVRLMRRLGRRVFVEFWGSEARIPSLEHARNPHYVNAYHEKDDENRARLQRWAELTGGHMVAADHSFHLHAGPYFPHIRVVRHRVDTRRIRSAPPRPDAKRPVVVHAPSSLAGKGTVFVREAVERLRGRGVALEYVEVHGKTQQEALEIYARADLIVDQLCTGGHGVFAAEAMAMGKPVVCFILPELVGTYPEGFPIINANPLDVAEVLEEWLVDGEARARRGEQSRAYAEREHDCRVVARRLVEAYLAE